MWVRLQVTEKHKYLANESTIVPFTILHCFVLWLLTDFASSNILNTSLVLSEWVLMNKSTNTLTNRSIAKEKLHHQYAIKMTQFIMYKKLLISWCWQGNSQVTIFSPFCFTAVRMNWKKWSLDLCWKKSRILMGAKWIVYTKGLVEEREGTQNRSARKTLSGPFCYSDKIVEKAACSPNPPNFWINCHLIAVES